MINKARKPTMKNILLIEDEGETCMLLKKLLADTHIKIDQVKNLSDAGTYLRTHQPSLILLDNRLPDGYGFDFLDYLKKNYPSVKIIMISGVDLAAGDFAIDSGADVFLPKPFTKAKLLELVGTLLN
jgi:two-component system, OmpR family, response regulator